MEGVGIAKKASFKKSFKHGPKLETQTRALSSLKSDFEADSGLIFCQGLAPAEKKDGLGQSLVPLV